MYILYLMLPTKEKEANHMDRKNEWESKQKHDKRQETRDE